MISIDPRRLMADAARIESKESGQRQPIAERRDIKPRHHRQWPWRDGAKTKAGQAEEEEQTITPRHWAAVRGLGCGGMRNRHDVVAHARNITHRLIEKIDYRCKYNRLAPDRHAA